MPTVPDLAARLRPPGTDRQPLARRRAGVAVVLRDVGPELELLLIRRVARDGDRWSGHIACPGGLCQPEDDGTLAAAIRETAEEVRIGLGAPLGRLRTVYTLAPGGYRPMAVVPWVFRAPADADPVPDPSEVAAAVWVSWSELGRRQWIPRRIGPTRVPVRGVRTPSGVLWGLTLQIVDDLRARAR